jgi:hypothetical protein
MAGLVSTDRYYGDVSCTVVYAPSVDEPKLTQVDYAIERSDAGMFETAAKFLSKPRTLDDIRVLGLITGVRRTKSGSGGIATLRCTVDGYQRTLAVALSALDYATAVNAHRDEQEVALRVELAVAEGRYRVTRVYSFDRLT